MALLYFALLKIRFRAYENGLVDPAGGKRGWMN